MAYGEAGNELIDHLFLLRVAVQELLDEPRKHLIKRDGCIHHLDLSLFRNGGAFLQTQTSGAVCKKYIGDAVFRKLRGCLSYSTGNVKIGIAAKKASTCHQFNQFFIGSFLDEGCNVLGNDFGRMDVFRMDHIGADGQHRDIPAHRFGHNTGHSQLRNKSITSTEMAML